MRIGSSYLAKRIFRGTEDIPVLNPSISVDELNLIRPGDMIEVISNAKCHWLRVIQHGVGFVYAAPDDDWVLGDGARTAKIMVPHYCIYDIWLISANHNSPLGWARCPDFR